MKPGPVGRLGAGRMQSSNTEDRGPHRERASPGPTLVTHTVGPTGRALKGMEETRASREQVEGKSLGGAVCLGLCLRTPDPYLPGPQAEGSGPRPRQALLPTAGHKAHYVHRQKPTPRASTGGASVAWMDPAPSLFPLYPL